MRVMFSIDRDRNAADTVFGLCFVDAVSFGSGKPGFADGEPDAAQFHAPYSLCLLVDPSDADDGDVRGDRTGTEWLLCADAYNNRIRRIDITTTGLVSTYVGSGVVGSQCGQRQESTLFQPYSLCADPIRAGGFYLGDVQTVRYCDGETVSFVAGGESGYADGVGGAAQFACVDHLLCSVDGKTLFVSDTQNRRLRAVNPKTQSVTTVCGDGETETRDGVGLDASLARPFQLCFDRSPLTTAAGSVIFIASRGGIRRFEVHSGTLHCHAEAHPNDFTALHCRATARVFIWY